MASPARYCPSCLSATVSSIPSRLTSRTLPPSFLLPFTRPQARTAADKASKSGKKKKDSAPRKKARATFLTPDLRQAILFPLADAMRYLKAAEVGRPPTSSKYELSVRFRTLKSGATIRNRMRLPHPVKTEIRTCVICPAEGPDASVALANGAVLVGEENVFELVREGKIDFDRCICHADSLAKLQKSGIARILGPRGLMPSAKSGTVTKDIRGSLRAMLGASEYRERNGVVRMAIGQLGFTPEEVQRNIKAFMEGLKRDIVGIQDRTPKEIHEVVLSSTNGPGMSLTGDLRGQDSVELADLKVV